MNTLSWITSGICFSLFVIFLVTQYVYLFLNIRNKTKGIDKNYSYVPLAVPISLTLAMLLAPTDTFNKYWYLIGIICIVDIGTLSLIVSIPSLVTMYAKNKNT